MTTSEVWGKAVAIALNNATSWGKNEALKALGAVSAMNKAGQCEDAVADEVRADLGNHSSTRQKLEKHGMLPVDDDAKISQLKLAISKLDAAEQAKQDAAMALGDAKPKVQEPKK